MLGRIFDLRRFSIHDGPGIRTTVFFKGCPLRCAWCHNPESQSMYQERIYHANRCIMCSACIAVCPQDALWMGESQVNLNPARCDVCGACAILCVADASQIVGQSSSLDEIFAHIGSDRAFFEQSGGGVSFSGGEPLLQAGFLKILLQKCQAAGIHTVVDTSGYARWETLDSLRSFVDLFLYDLKFIDAKRHTEFTGVSNALILDNLRQLALGEHKIWVRVPVIPGINDDLENLAEIAAFVAALPGTGVQRLDLLPYHRTATEKYARLQRAYPLADVHTPTSERLEALVTFIKDGALRNSQVPIHIGG